jgi:transposase
VEISVVNPRRARRFAESLGERSKTDPVDARVLCEYVMRMPWVPWVPPNLVTLRLRSLTRAIVDLVVMQTQEKNRQHSLMASHALPVLVIRNSSIISGTCSSVLRGCDGKRCESLPASLNLTAVFV